MISQLAGVLAPVILCAAAGLLWGRLRQPFETRTIAAIVINITTPCLIVHTLTRLLVDPAALGAFALATACCLALTMAAAWTVLRIAGLPRDVYLPAMFLGNTGNTGLPLCLFAFGDAGLAYAITYFVVTAVSQYSIGPAIASGSRDVRRLLRMPVLWAVLIAVAMMALHARPPAWLANALKLLGDVTIPMMLFALGVALSRMRAGAIGLGLLLSAAKLAIGLAVGFGVAALFGFTGAARGVMVIQASMPVAVFAYLIAEHFGKRADDIAGLVMVSTLLTLVALPGILWLVL